MADPNCSTSYVFDQPGKYRICVMGSLDERWIGGLDDPQIRIRDIGDQERPIAELTCTVRDQAELSGILEALYERHLTLVSVKMLENE